MTQKLYWEKLRQLIDSSLIRGISIDSRRVVSGDIFFAMTGDRYGKSEIQKFIKQAINRGAQLIVTEEGYGISTTVPVVSSPDIRNTLALTAEYLYPALPQNLIAVTGTNGKSSVVHYFQQILSRLGIPSASIGTMGITTSDGSLNEHFTATYSGHATTNDIATTRNILNTLSRNNVADVAMEVSSHGIAQQRVESLRFNAAVFTHLGYDHLDYHKEFEEYLQTKLALFDKHYLVDNALIILNADTMRFRQIYDQVSRNGHKVLVIVENEAVDGIDLSKQVIWQTILRTPITQKIDFSYRGSANTFEINMTGKFQVFNILAASLLALYRGLPWERVSQILPSIRPVKGRLQAVTTDEPWQVFIDYAHTPDSLQLALEELKSLVGGSGRLIVVFGCGGNRDQSKRPIMGQISSMLADLVIVTDDNPRHESAADIRKAVLIGTQGNSLEIADRKQAIAYAIALLQPMDILLIAGKGHENYQTIGDNDIAFDDFLVTEELLKQKQNRE